MSIKWMRGPYHYITVWYMSKIYTSTSKLAKAIVMTGSKDTLIWLPTTYKVCQTPFICMKWIWYEYAGDGRSQSYPTACPQWEIHSKSYNPARPFGAMVWYGVVANMTACHGWRLLNTFCRYEVNLVWVWSGWEVPIISYSMSPVRTPLRILLPSPLPFGVMVWYGVAPLRPPTTYKAWQTLSLCMKWIWYEYEVDRRAQSYPTACPQWEPHSESYDWPTPC